MLMKILWLLLITGLIKVRAYQWQCPPTKESIQQLLDQVNIPGAAIVIVTRNQTIYQQGIGYHSPLISDDRHPIDPSKSIFLLASISKTFIVVAALQMVESKRLNLDADINEYLPPEMMIVHPHYPEVKITTRHLLRHTAGINTNSREELAQYVPGDTFIGYPLGDVIKKYLNNTANWLPISPGNITLYSNMGASLAAFIVERLANMSFDKYVQERILKPLGIDEKNAGYRLSNFVNQQQNLVQHFVFNSSWLPAYRQMLPQLNISQAGGSSDWMYIPLFGATRYPSGFLRMSAHSLGIFFQSFLNDFSLLLHKSSSVKEMLYVFPQESYMNRSETEYSLIWNWLTIGQRRLVGHRGTAPGITTSMMTDEKRRLGVIVLTNGDSTRPDDQAKEAGEAVPMLVNTLFDCFETQHSAGHTNQNNLVSITLLFFHIISVKFS